MRQGSALGRVVGVVGVLLLIGLVLRLILAILTPVLPPAMTRDLTAGFDMLYSMVGPAMVPIAAAGILIALCWVIVGKRK